MRFCARLSFFVALTLSTAAGAAFAAWPPGGVHLERPAPATSSGIPQAGPDGLGGMFVAWPETDTLGVMALRVHRLDINGNPPPGWTTTGVRVGTFSQSLGPLSILPDGTGGAYLCLSNYLDAGYLLRVAPDGSVSPGWPAGGVALASAAGQTDLVATGDGTGGVLLAWQRSSSGATHEIVAQRILADGSRGPGFPADGRVVTSTPVYNSASGSFRPRLVRDADRGFWISFSIVQVDTLIFPSKYAVLHLDPSGIVTPGQPANGLALSLPAGEVATFNYPHVPVPLAPDGGGGTFAFTLGINGVVRAFHLTSTLVEDGAWPVGGVALASGAGWPSVHFPVEENWPVAAGDLAGSAYVGWRDEADFYLHGSRVNLDGTIASGWATPPVVGGEMVITWMADAGGLYASSMPPSNCAHFDCTGPLVVNRMTPVGLVAPGWPISNTPYSDAPGARLGFGGPNNLTTMASDGAGGVLIAWVAYPEYYATRLLINGATSVMPAPITDVPPMRAHFDPGSGVRVSFAATWPSNARLELFDVAGRRLASASVAGATSDFDMPGTRSLASGLYLVRLASPTRGATARVFVTR